MKVLKTIVVVGLCFLATNIKAFPASASTSTTRHILCSELDPIKTTDGAPPGCHFVKSEGHGLPYSGAREAVWISGGLLCIALAASGYFLLYRVQPGTT